MEIFWLLTLQLLFFQLELNVSFANEQDSQG